MSSVDCASCGRTITPGQRREPSSNGPIHEFCRHRQEVREAYRFYIQHRDEGAFGYGFWRNYENREMPVLVDTGGQATMFSEAQEFGDGIKPTTDFVTAFGYTLHHLLCLGYGYDPKAVESELENFYENGKIPDQERWALHHLLTAFLSPPGPSPELQPLREFATRCTEMPVPETRGSIPDHQ
jgi:hypothetical protein